MNHLFQGRRAAEIETLESSVHSDPNNHLHVPTGAVSTRD